MNDHELDLALQAMGRDRTAVADPPTLRERVARIPLTARRRHRWLPHFTRGEFSMFSALKLVAATAIVALFGGFLLSGILTTQQSDVGIPAAATESPSPTMTEGLLSRMVTEEVEPGVFRIDNDGVRDLASRGEPDNIALAPDGGVWTCGEKNGLFQLGGPAVNDIECPSVMEVASDATLWGSTFDEVVTFDGSAWTGRARAGAGESHYFDIASGPDGVVWALRRNGNCSPSDDDCRVATPVRLAADGSATDVPIGMEVHDDSLWIDDLTVGPDGDVWVTVLTQDGGWDVATLLHYDGDRWEAVAPPEGALSQNGSFGQALGVAPDGTLWIGAEAEGGGNAGLAQLDDSGWTVFSAEDGVRTWGTPHRFIFLAHLRVAPDGSVWVNASAEPEESGCAGVARFDGTTWKEYLAGVCVDGLQVAPDGAVWVVGESDQTAYRGTGSVDLYVVTPAYTETEGIPYLTIGDITYEADIYVPESEGSSPVAVMFHGNAPRGKDDGYTTVVAEAAAAAGMHVLVPNWLTGTTGITSESFDVFHAAANCAVAYAQAHLGDGSPTVVYGFSAGVGPAARAAFDPATEPIPGCMADDPPAPVTGAVLGDGEYFLHSSIFDGAFSADPEAMQAVVTSLVDPTAWPVDMETRFRLWVAEDGTLPRTFDDPWDESGWLARRDPDGSIRADLDRLGQLDDGVVSFIDEGQLMELRLREAGIEVSLDSYPGGHSTGDKVAELVGYLTEAAAVD